MKKFFKGYYFKHQKEDFTLSIIVGKSSFEKFIQIITNEYSERIPFTNENHFSINGISLNIKTDKTQLKGKIRYKNLSPIQYHIMGPFVLLPMQCKHEIISMKHLLEGSILFNGKEYDFNNGTGYIEMDQGRSFPSSYMWIQANDFKEDCAITVAVAHIPFCCFHFKGTICIIQYQGKEYRIATYLGGRIILCNEHELILKQRSFMLRIKVDAKSGYKLLAPQNGKMTRTIIESISCPAEFHFIKSGKTIFRLHSSHTSYEFEKNLNSK